MTATLSPTASKEFWSAGILSSTTNHPAKLLREIVEGIGSQVGASEWVALASEYGLTVGFGAYTSSLPNAYVRTGIAQGASTSNVGTASREFEILVEEHLPRIPRATMFIRAKFEFGVVPESRLLGGSESLED